MRRKFIRYTKNLGFTQNKWGAYGRLQGYLVTLSEVSQISIISVSFCSPDLESFDRVQRELQNKAIKTTYKIQQLEIHQTHLRVTISNFMGNPKNIQKFLDYCLPMLSSSGVSGETHCSHCKQEIVNNLEKAYKMIDKIAYVFHQGCAVELEKGYIEEQKDLKKVKGNYGRGFIGAMLGAVIGAIPWTIVYLMGWFVGWLGLLIGLAAKKGYTLFGGKIKKPSIFVLLISIIFGVLIGQIAGDVISVILVYLSEGWPVTVNNILLEFDYYFKEPGNVLSFLFNCGLGLLFAFLGTASIFKGVHDEASLSSKKPIDIQL